MEGIETWALESEGGKGWFQILGSREKGAGVTGILRPQRTKVNVLDSLILETKTP